MPVTFRLLAAIILAAALGLALPAEARTWKQVYPLQKQRTFSIASEGVTVTVTPPPPYPDEEEVTTEEFQASYEDATITVIFPGVAPYAVPADRYRSSPYGISIGIGKLNRRDAAPTVFIGGYSGGMHCCATMQAVSLVDGAPVAAILPMMDGEPLTRFPRDIDGDGTIDLRWSDDSLLYAFSSHAGSWQVPRIYAIRDGQAVDVSREPRFARIYRQFADEALEACREDDPESAGACAAHAYARAILGEGEEGIRAAVALAEEPSWYPIDCTVEWVDDQCPEGKERQFAGFEDALRWIMRKNGYLQ